METNDKESSATGTDNRYVSDVDEAPYTAASFVANLMQTGPSTVQGTSNDIDFHSEVHTYDNHFFDNMNLESVPTDVSSVIPGEIYVITILDDLRSQLEGHIKTNEEQSLANDALKAELERYKTQVQNLEQNICSVVLTSDIAVEPRSNCVKEYSRNLELEAEILKMKQLLVEKEKRFEKIRFKGKKRVFRKLKAKIGNMKEVSADSNLTTLEFQALETKNTQLKEELTAVRIKNDSLRDENLSIKKRYQDLYQSKAKSNNNMSSRAAVPEKPKVLAPGLYAMTPKYIPPQKRNNKEANTPLPKEREVASAKPHHMIAPGSSRYSSNDIVHNHYLEEAKKQTHEIGRNSKTSVIPSARSQSTVNGSKPKPRINNQKSRNWPASKTSYVTTKTKCVFNANHDHCVTKFLNEVNSHAKVPSNKTTNKNNPVEQINVAKKPERQISKGHRFSIKKTSVVHEKTMTPRSCLRWKPTGKIFKILGLRWVPTRKIFTSSTTKVDSEPTNGSDEDITNQYEYKETLDVSACTPNLSAGLRPNSMALGHNDAGPEINNLQSGRFGSGLVTTPTTPSVPPTEKKLLQEMLTKDFLDSLIEKLLLILLLNDWNEPQAASSDRLIYHSRLRIFQDYLREEELRLCLIKCKFPWNDDNIVDRNFWLKLVCLDLARKGWVTEELLLQNGMPLFYANEERYTTTWSEVDQVFIPINETGEHWCLAQFHIMSGELTFYDTGHTYDYDYRDWYVRIRHCLQVVTDEDVEGSASSGMIATNAGSKALYGCVIVREELKIRCGRISFVAKQSTKLRDVGCSSDTKKWKRGLGTSSMPSNGDTGLKIKATVATPNCPVPQASRRTTGPAQKRAGKKARKPAALASTFSFHKPCASSTEYAVAKRPCGRERINKGNISAIHRLLLCCHEGSGWKNSREPDPNVGLEQFHCQGILNGGPRYTMQNYQYAMALCRSYGNPNLFITFTSNPKWPEINEMLAYVPGQRAHDQPEVGTRVFKLKLTELLDDLTKNLVFGKSHAVARSCVCDTGKTFLYKTIISRLRSERKIVLAVASLGIASLLLPAGRTTHSTFVIPLELLENSTCGIKQNTHLAKLMQEVELIIWDEAPMTQKYAFKALDKTLRDILGYPAPEKKNKIFSGMTIMLSKKHIDTYESKGNDAYLKRRAILTPRNDDADAINAYMFDKLEGESVTYNSADEICKASIDTLDYKAPLPNRILKYT
ncbi:retrovirus-related pol polyprotein from transposon TNT 1-94 [Tanacetum coccineum]